MIQKNWQELIRPNKLEIIPGDDGRRTATVVAEPLERGFGQTLGNSLRRVLLVAIVAPFGKSFSFVCGLKPRNAACPGVQSSFK